MNEVNIKTIAKIPNKIVNVPENTLVNYNITISIAAGMRMILSVFLAFFFMVFVFLQN